WARAVFTARRTMRGRSSSRRASVAHFTKGVATGGRSDQRIGSVTVKDWSCWPAVSSSGEWALYASYSMPIALPSPGETCTFTAAAADARLGPAPPLLLAARRRPTPFTPVWLMRQAGRYLPEYRALRTRHAFLELAKTPQTAAEVTLQPVERLGVDAAILFADILLIVEPLRVGLEYAKGEGAVSHRPVPSHAD